MNRRTFCVLFVMIGLFVLAVGIYGFAFSTTTQTQTETIAASTGFFAQFELAQGDTVKGALTILDGNEGIVVYVENPVEEVIYNGGTVYNSLEFSFTAQTAGSHTINFENLSPASQQTIEYSLTYSTIPRTVSISATVIGAVFFVSGMILAVTSSKKR